MAENKGTKVDIWLNYYLDDSNPETFFNKTASAIKAGYNCTSQASFRNIGLKNFKSKEKLISQYLDDVGMSENQIKAKIVNLMNAQRTQFFQYKGVVVDQKDVEALDIQVKATDMAIKVKGMYAAEKKELFGKDGAPISIITAIPEPDPLDEDE